MVPTSFAVVALLIAAVCIVATAAALVVGFRYAIDVIKSADERVKSAHNDAMNLARANSDMKFMPLIMQTSAAISQAIEERVSNRVRIINTNLQADREANTPEPTARTISEPPPMGSSSIIDEAHEIERGLRRFTREGFTPEMAAREAGIGADVERPEEI